MRPYSATDAAADEGATVEICTPDGVVFARGMVVSGADVVQETAGRSMRDLPARVAHEVVHRDDLVLLPH